ncbi:hypothetical protein [Nocardia cyriacigeorgica]|uniref:hypothetical protein n=1 Tax=Nocardia cyriacigeorgica TaxID=135487 RepID=UPI0024562FFB|nr:hypothetical protein [Nocardia cyriacigeorgica]
MLAAPDVQVYEGEGVIRWAVGSPDGLRSRTWTVIGTRAGDVYISQRFGMKDLKLSLHPSKWRMALTSEAASVRLRPGEDRVLSRWEHTKESAPGWRLGATITVPHCALVPPFSEAGGKKVRWFPTPGPEQSLRFIVLLGAPDRQPLAVNNTIGDVGRISLATGGAVWVIAFQDFFGPENEAEHRRLRQLPLPESVDEEVHGFAWGNSDADGSPMLIELGNVAPASDVITNS